MQVPKNPVDIKIVFGAHQQYHDSLVNISIDLSDNKQTINLITQERKIPKNLLKSCVMITDYYTQKGKEKQAVKYFNNSEQKSPLKIMFNYQPQQFQDVLKISIQEHKGFIRVIHHFKINNSEDENKLNEIFKIFQSLTMSGHIDIMLKGTTAHTTNNAQCIKVDYAEISLIANQLFPQNLVNLAIDLTEFQSEVEKKQTLALINLLKKSKTIRAQLKFDSFRNINRFYRQVSFLNEQKNEEIKELKYINKGIFKQRINFTLLFKNKYVVSSIYHYKNQDVLMRVIKINAKFLEKILERKIYFDD